MLNRGANLRKARKEWLYEHRMLEGILNGKTRLDVEEIKKIKEVWGPAARVPLKWGHDYFLAYKILNGFDPSILPQVYEYPYFYNKFNPHNSRMRLCHKSLNEMIYGKMVATPHTVLRTYGGAFLNSDYRAVSRNEALEILNSTEEPLLIKEATESMQGLGVKLVGDKERQCLTEYLKGHRRGEVINDFVIQKFVGQSEETKKFNPTSLNCFRVTTLNLNGSVSTHNICFKAGPVNSIVDNIGTGKRGVMVGMDLNGELRQFGLFGNGEKTPSHNGVKFEGVTIPGIGNLIETALRLHSVVEECALVGWDLALDADNKPVLIEGNTIDPGISAEQLVSGPIFGERTGEAIDYLRK